MPAKSMSVAHAADDLGIITQQNEPKKRTYLHIIVGDHVAHKLSRVTCSSAVADANGQAGSVH